MKKILVLLSFIAFFFSCTKEDYSLAPETGKYFATLIRDDNRVMVSNQITSLVNEGNGNVRLDLNFLEIMTTEWGWTKTKEDPGKIVDGKLCLGSIEAVRTDQISTGSDIQGENQGTLYHKETQVTVNFGEGKRLGSQKIEIRVCMNATDIITTTYFKVSWPDNITTVTSSNTSSRTSKTIFFLYLEAL